ncbi:MAG: nicotinate (nicotinamide) nucleotide adenylyltransferase [Oscillospiraceae bacterium]
MRRILVYGGGFNPPHLGHEHMLKIAIEAVEPDLTLVVPSAIAPHKKAAAVSLTQRAEMCRTFKSCGKNIKISEIEQAGRHDKSYTVKTLRRLSKIYKNSEFFFLIGSDMLMSFESWHRYRRILPLATLLAASRESDDKSALLREKTRLEKMGGQVLILGMEPMPMSSTEIRAKLKNHENTDAFLSKFTQNIIKKHKIYI